MQPAAGLTSSRGCQQRAAGLDAAGKSPGIRRLLPDLGLAVSILTFLYCLFVYDGARKLFRDSDTGWHIRTGEAILSGGGLPRSDPYSFSREGEPWFAWEWAADVAMGAAHRAGGPGGVVLLYAAAIAAASWLWFRLHWAAGGNFLLACALASPMLSTVSLHWLARPHVFGWLFLLGAVLYLEKRAGQVPLRKDAAAIAAFSCLWANIHASFFLGWLAALAYAAGAFLRPILWDLDRAGEWRRALRYIAAAGLAAAASLVNPYGWRLHQHLWAYLTNRELLERVAEFQSFNFHTEGSWQILMVPAAAAAGGLLAAAQRNPAHAILAAGFLWAAFRSARGLPVAALILLPLANGALTRALRDWRDLSAGARRRLDAFLDYSDRLRALDRSVRGWALAPLVLALAAVWLRSPAVAQRTGFPPEEFPVEASGAVEKLPTQARILAPDKYGGYLIYRFAGRRKVFFDGRSDFYGSDFMKAYIRLVEVRPGWQAQVDAWRLTHALLPNDSSLAAALEQVGWRRLWRDGTATLLERD